MTYQPAPIFLLLRSLKVCFTFSKSAFYVQ